MRYIFLLAIALLLQGCSNIPIIGSQTPIPIIQQTGSLPIDPNIVSDYPQSYILDVNSMTLPSEFDLTKDLLCPVPFDQGLLASCVACSIGYSMRTTMVAKDWKLSPFLTDNEPSPMFLYKMCIIDQNKKYGSGLDIKKAFDTFVKYGSNSLTNSPYDYQNTEEQINITPKDNYKFRIDNYRVIDVKDDKMIKYFLNQGRPIVFSLALHLDFINYPGGVYEGKDKYWYTSDYSFVPAHHAMTIIGYSGSKKAYHVMNSWGFGYGEGGYVWISYENFRKDGNIAVVANQYFQSMPAQEYIKEGNLDVELKNVTQIKDGNTVLLSVDFEFSKPCNLELISITNDKGITFTQKYGLWDRKDSIFFYKTDNMYFPEGDYRISFKADNMMLVKNFKLINPKSGRSSLDLNYVFGMNRKRVF